MMRIAATFLFVASSLTRAGVDIALVPDPNRSSYGPGEIIKVDVYVRLTAGTPSIPGPGGTTTAIRLKYMQLDFGASDPALGLEAVEHHPWADIGPIPFWDFQHQNTCAGDEASCGTNYFIDGSLGDDLASITYTGLTSSSSFMIQLNQSEARQVAEMNVTMPTEPGTYVLDVLNAGESDPNRGGEVRWGFGSTADPTDPTSPLRANTGGIMGNQLQLAVEGCLSNEDCFDFNPCTDDLRMSGTCENPFNTGPCSDGLPCTVNDTCSNGMCEPGPPPDCSDAGGPCMIASCDPIGTDGNCDILTNVLNGTSCSDNVYCNGEETCFDGICINGNPPCINGLGCFEASQSCEACLSPAECYDNFDCIIKNCMTGFCVFDGSNCEGTCCFPGLQCFDGLTRDECLSFQSGQYLGHELDCESDPDNDGNSGCLDQCPFDPLKISPGFCGCGNSDEDEDDDGIPDCIDCCPETVAGQSVDDDGCVPLGGCRSSSGTACLDGVDAQFCSSVGGVYYGNGTTCALPCLYCRGRGTPAEDSQGPKCRFISIVPSMGFPCDYALQVKLVSLHHVDPPYTGGVSTPFTCLEGQVRWVGPPAVYLESTSSGSPFLASTLQCTPHYQDWSTVGLLHITGSEIVPSSTYEVRSVAITCQGFESSCGDVSDPLSMDTSRWGDVEEPYNPPSSSIQPDLGDISAMVNKFRSEPGAPIKARTLLTGIDSFGHLDIAPEFSFTHIASCVDAFRGRPYPHMIETCP